MWRIAQPLYGLGPIVVAVGVGCLAAAAQGRGTRAVLMVSCAGLAIGALAWIWSLYLRGTRVSEFAYGTLPGWPFAMYVLPDEFGAAAHADLGEQPFQVAPHGVRVSGEAWLKRRQQAGQRRGRVCD